MKKLDEINQELEELERFEEGHSNKINKFILVDFILLAGTLVMLYGALLGNALIVQ